MFIVESGIDADNQVSEIQAIAGLLVSIKTEKSLNLETSESRFVYISGQSYR